jgi:hypothetical protein
MAEERLRELEEKYYARLRETHETYDIYTLYIKQWEEPERKVQYLEMIFKETDAK